MLTVYSEGVIQSLDIHSKRLVGDIMTLIEGALPATDATKALKKSIKQSIWRTNRTIQTDVNETSFQNEDDITND